MKNKILTGSIIAAYALLNTSSFAEETILDPIVVSADFREAKLSDTANAVSVIREEDIYDKASAPLEEVIGKTPNVNFTTAGSRAHHIQIRGIGERAQFQYPINPSVGLNVDGIDFSNTPLAVTMFDVKQIEVLKGPQGTNFGANGMAGVVNIESNEPTRETQGHVETTIGNYNTKAVGVALGGELSENLLGRLSVYKNTSDGFMKNATLDRDDTQNIDELSLKSSLKWFISDKHTIDFNFMHVNVDNGYDAYTFDNSRTSYSDEPGNDTLKTNAFAITSTYHLNRKMHLVSKVDYSDIDNTYSFDNDWWYAGGFIDGTEQYIGTDSYDRNIKSISIDERVVSNDAGRIFGHTTDWILGLYHQNKTQKLFRSLKYSDTSPYADHNDIDSDYETKTTALYGQLNTKLSKRLSLVSGIRIENWKSDYKDAKTYFDDLNSSNNTSPILQNITTNETLYGGKLGLNFEYDDKTLLYGFVSKGYKPGGVNVFYDEVGGNKTYETESIWDIEIGVNSKHFNDTLLSRTNIFYQIRKDQHITLTKQVGINFYDYLSNAAKGHNTGIESELDFYPNDSLHIYSNIALLMTKYDDYNPTADGYDLEGREQAQSPNYQYNIGFDYSFAGQYRIMANIEGKGSQYYEEYTDKKIDAYNIFNAGIEYSRKNWLLTLWIKNIADKDYDVKAYDFGNKSADVFSSKEYYSQKGAPRTFGFTLAYDF